MLMAGAGLAAAYFIGSNYVFLEQSKAECAKFTDKHLEKALAQIDEGIKDLQQKNPNMSRPNINSGLRGTRYFIEFPITGKNIDAFSILASTQSLINNNK